MQVSPTLLCIPLMGTTVDRMLIEMKKAREVGGDLVGIRLDCLKDFNPQRDIEILIKHSPLPTLVTYRHSTPDKNSTSSFHFSSLSFCLSDFDVPV